MPYEITPETYIVYKQTADTVLGKRYPDLDEWALEVGATLYSALLHADGLPAQSQLFCRFLREREGKNDDLIMQAMVQVLAWATSVGVGMAVQEELAHGQ